MNRVGHRAAPAQRVAPDLPALDYDSTSMAETCDIDIRDHTAFRKGRFLKVRQTNNNNNVIIDIVNYSLDLPARYRNSLQN